MNLQEILNAQNLNWGLPPIKPDPDEFSAFSAYYKAAQNRLTSPGLADSAFIVSYTHGGNLKEQYVYSNIWDAMREVLALKDSEREGLISLSIYTDESGIETIRNWEYEYEGYYNMDGDAVVECAGWVKYQ